MKIPSFLVIDPVGVKAGMDYYDLNLARALTSKGVTTFIASNFEKNDACLKYFDSEKKESAAAKLRDMVKGFTSAISFAKRKRIKYVVLHIFSTEAKDLLFISMVKAANLKLIAIVHDISGFAKTDSSWIKHIIFNKYADYLVVHNNYSYHALLEVVNKKVAKKISIIPHGSFINLPEKSVTREKARVSLGLPSGQKVILFFGQIKKVKGLDILIDAMQLINQDIMLVIAGKPWKEEFATYQHLITKHSLEHRVKLFIRYIRDTERELFFKAADLLIIPYREIYQSGVLLMGMSYQLPVLASDIEANRELIKDNFNGLLFKAGDSVDLAKKANIFFSDGTCKELSENAFKMMEENHNWDKIADQYIQVINENRNNRIQGIPIRL